MQSDERRYLISELVKTNSRIKEQRIPDDEDEQRKLLRGLMNVREAGEVSDEFLAVQDKYLKEVIAEKGITRFSDLKPVRERIYLWQGDITLLEADAIVNAANSGMTGCYVPNHNCIDNCIHTYAGVQLRNACAKIMKEQGYPEPVGQAKITDAYNLPSRYVIHTVGPQVNGRLTDNDRKELASSYQSCLELAYEKGLKSIAFCSISTGVFGFPKEEAAEIAVETVSKFLETHDDIEVVFNVYGNSSLRIYEEILNG